MQLDVTTNDFLPKSNKKFRFIYAFPLILGTKGGNSGRFGDKCRTEYSICPQNVLLDGGGDDPENEEVNVDDFTLFVRSSAAWSLCVPGPKGGWWLFLSQKRKWFVFFEVPEFSKQRRLPSFEIWGREKIPFARIT